MRRAALALLGATFTLACGPEDAAAPQAQPPATCSTHRGAAVDLAPWVRLSAGPTRSTGLSAAPHEGKDVIATVRDDDAVTGWKVEGGAASTLEVDLGPWPGRAVSLSSLELGVTGASVGAAKVELSAACGGAVTTSLDWPDIGQALDLGGSCAGCLRVTFTAPGESDIVRLALFTTDADVAPPDLDVAGIVPAATRFAGSGVIEGFYGVPWSWRERRFMVARMAEVGFDTYLYAPKNDPLHRAQWRTPYGADDMARFGALGTLADSLGVTLYLGISPFIDFEFGGEADYLVLRDKMRFFVDAGVKGIGLLADDIDLASSGLVVDGSLGAEHRDVANRLLADLRAVDPGVRLSFVPTVYNDAALAQPGGAEYLVELRTLDPSIQVMWTGSAVFAPTMSAADLGGVTTAVGRKPQIWDNYWANDLFNEFRGRALLGPLHGRAPDLPGAVTGLAFNPSVQGSLSRLSVATAAYALAHLAAPDDGAARAFAAGFEPGAGFAAGAGRDRDVETATFALQVFDGWAQQVPRCSALVSALAALGATLDAGSDPSAYVHTLLPLAGRMAALPGELHHSSLSADLVDELGYPAEKARLEGHALLLTLVALGELRAGRPGSDALAAAEDALIESTASRIDLGNGEVGGLRAKVVALTPADTGVQPLALADPPPSCHAGQPLAWAPFSDPGLHVEISGLPGATASGDVTFSPAHGGRYHAVAVGWRDSDGAWGVVEADLLCE